MEENCHQPVRMAEICHRDGMRFAYFSSSYVFDGTAGPYDEDAVPNPINSYARSKWEAERRLNDLTDGASLLLRIICVYGEELRKKNFAYQVHDAMRAGKVLRLPSDQRGNPTWAGDIASGLMDLLDRRATGVWHLGGPDPECTRTQWAKELVRQFRGVGVALHPEFKIEGVPTRYLGQPAPRPLRAGLISRKWTNPTLGTRISEAEFASIAKDKL
jgi:dTDP-4-dehydrorhamnose reductase